MARARGELKLWVTVIASLLIALLLDFILPFDALKWFRPYCFVSVMLVWVLVFPERFGIGAVWLLGLFLDALFDAPIGQNAFTLVCAAYFLIKFNERIRLLGYWQVVAMMFGLFTLYQFFPLMMQLFSNEYLKLEMVLTRSVVSALVYPYLVIILRNYQRRTGLE